MIVRSYNPIEHGRRAIWLDQPVRDDLQVAVLLRQLREFDEDQPDGPVDIVIAGGGGKCDVGLALYTALREHPRPKRVTIYDAPSISGLIAMAGDHVRIVEGGRIFLHGAGFSTDYLVNDVPRHMPAAALRALARHCDATDALHCRIFARRTGLDPARIQALRAAETAIGAAEAVRLRFADEIIAPPKDFRQ